MLLSDLPPWLTWSTAIVLGLCLGSFLNVVVYRLPREMSLSSPPSTCPACGVAIPAYRNVPVIGWLVLRGRAACCGAPISVRYPLVEALGGVLAALVLAVLVGRNPESPLDFALVWYAGHLALALGLLALALIDLDYLYLPDSLTLGGAALGVILARFGYLDVRLPESLDALVGGYVLVWFPFVYLHEKLRGFPGMGLGDAKLLALTGAWFGGFGVFFVLFAGAVQGTLATLGVTALGIRIAEPVAVTKEREELRAAIEAAVGPEKEELERLMASDPALAELGGGLGRTRIPFGPFLALGALELLFFGPLLRAKFFEFVGWP